ncbi:MAG: hypothetical protein AB7H93_04950 [Vicinamibacterales bacterium]
MRHRWGRWSLVVLAVAVAAGTVAWTLRIEGELREIRASAVSARGFARTGRTALQDVRRALAAMAAPGQAAVGWSRRAEAALEDARRQMEGLIALAPGGDARGALDVFERLAESERRLREHAAGGKPLMAADVAFGEAMPYVDDLERRLDGGLDAVTSGADRAAAELRDRQAAAWGLALAAVLFAATVLAPLPRPAAFAASSDSAADDRLDTTPVPDVPAAAPAAAAPAVDLAALSLVCARLAAVSDAQALPGLLEEAARAIGARGAMLWLADAAGQTLRIAAAYGYDPRLLARIGEVAAGADNPTARAFRTGLAETQAARAGQPAATAVPVRGGHGVRGVLAVELVDETPAAVSAAAAATAIVAAQLSLLVAPAADTDTARAHGAP